MKSSPFIVTKHHAPSSGHYTIAVMTPIEDKPFKGVFVRPTGAKKDERAVGKFTKFESVLKYIIGENRCFF